MQINTALIKFLIVFNSIILALAPLNLINADSSLNAGVTANVVQQQTSNITLNSITAIKTSGIANGTFQDGWEWIFDITIPSLSEDSLVMQFSNWSALGSGTSTIPVAGNIRFFSSQSSNANSESNALYISSANTDSTIMNLPGNLNSGSTRRVKITVQSKIPPSANVGGYSLGFKIKTLAINPNI